MSGWIQVCLKQVSLLNMAQLRVLNILSALAGRKPVYNIAADVLNVTYEWLAFPGKTLLHWLHTWLTLRNDPMM